MTEAEIRIVAGSAVPVRGDEIDTDRILPARYLKEITFANMGEYPFIDERFDAQGGEKAHPFNAACYRTARILLANANFGCGSSREHAPQALARWGIRAIVAESYGEIFAGNCLKIGLPAVRVNLDAVRALQDLAAEKPETEFSLDLGAMAVSAGELSFSVSMPEGYRQALLDGTWDSTSVLRANMAAVKETAERMGRMWG